MATYKCVECGHIFEEGEEAVWDEDLGEYFGSYSSKRVTGCPLCHGNYEETKTCKICGSSNADRDLVSGVCRNCIEEYRYDINTCYEIGKNDSYPIKINCLLTDLFTPDEIEKILFNELKKRQKLRKVDCQNFIKIDEGWFAERLLEVLEK